MSPVGVIANTVHLSYVQTVTEYSAKELRPDEGPWWVIHELGHFFGLCHTFSCNGEENCSFDRGEDGIADTLTQEKDDTRDDMATANFGDIYANLSTEQQDVVDDTWFNVMSYNGPKTKKNRDTLRMTEDQLDRWTDAANSARRAFVSGETHFVDAGGRAGGAGDSTNPYATVQEAVAAADAGGGDIILLRAGVYDETFTLIKPCLLNAPRENNAIIGN